MRHVVVLDLSNGYKVSSVPSVKGFRNDTWGVDVKTKQEAGKLYYDREFVNGHLYLYPSAFEQWNKVLENLFPTYKQSVVLSK